MDFYKIFVVSILVFHVALQQIHCIHVDQKVSNDVSETLYSPKIDCSHACAGRCKLSRRPRLCQRACGTCCARCNCVPAGTYGNFNTCPCYAALTTHHNKRKCP